MNFRRLILMRHATAADSGTVGDIDRPLTPSGLAEAARMGERLATLNWSPDQVLCSVAVRCQETWAQVESALRTKTQDGSRESSDVRPINVDFDDQLYNAPADHLLQATAEWMPSATTLLLIAHNPGISQLAFEIGRGDPEQEEILRSGFSPASIARFEIPIMDEAGGSGTLREPARRARLLDFERP